jgi:hypothetical protein
MGRRAAIIAVTVVAAAGGIILTSTPSGGGGSDTANLWVDTNGGTCTDNASLTAYSDAAACGTFDAAYEAAEAGDVVRIAAGSYGAQTMNGPDKGSGAQIAFAAEGDGDDVTVQTIDFSADRVDFSNFEITYPSWSCASGNPCGNTQIISITNAASVTFEDVDIDRSYLVGDGLGINGNVQGVTWTDSTICCNAESKLVNIQRQTDTGLPVLDRPENEDITFEDVRIGDQVYTATSYPGEPPHAECLFPISVTNFVLERVEMYECISTGNMNWGGTGNTTFRFTNTVWGYKYGFSSGVDVVDGAGVGYRDPTPSGSMIDGANTNGVGVIEYSIFAQSWVCSGQTSITVRGNIGVGCGCTYTEAYNTWTNQDCGANDTQNANILDTGNFVDRDGLDWRPSSGSAPQVNVGDPSNCPSVDLGGLPRPVGGTCDQGAYEWQG